MVRKRCCENCVFSGKVRDGAKILYVCSNVPDCPGQTVLRPPDGVLPALSVQPQADRVEPAQSLRRPLGPLHPADSGPVCQGRRLRLRLAEPAPLVGRPRRQHVLRGASARW